MARKRVYALYCDPIELHNALMERKKTGVTDNKLGKMYQLMIAGIMSRPNFVGYFGEIRDHMEYLAIHNLIKYVHNYDPQYFEVNQNAAFTYVTRIIMQAFTTSITLIKKQQAKEDVYMELLRDTVYSDLYREIGEQWINGNKGVDDNYGI